VLRSGTAAGVRAGGFTAPAAGKTGTSHDGWFAGYTSELLCIVWVGFDDNRQLDLEGAHSAAPIWAEFMKRALQFREYANPKTFAAPDGIVSLNIDPESGMPATPFCPRTRQEVYIAGTEPVGTCPLHNGGRQNVTNVAGWETSPPPAGRPVSPEGGSVGAGTPPVVAQRQNAGPQEIDPSDPARPEPNAKKPGVLRRLLNVFK